MRVPGYIPRTERELIKALQWAAKELYLDAWTIDYLHKPEPESVYRAHLDAVPAALFSSHWEWGNFYGIIWGDLQRCEAVNVDPLFCVFHEIAHGASSALKEELEAKKMPSHLRRGFLLHLDRLANRMAVLLYRLYRHAQKGKTKT